MPVFDTIKTTIFPKESDQKSLIDQCCPGETNFDRALEILFQKPERDLQFILAPFLRAATIDHLREKSTPYTRSVADAHETAFLAGVFRELPLYNKSYDDYLIDQSKSGVYAEEREGGALAELLNITFIPATVNATLQPNQNSRNRRSVGGAVNLDAPQLTLYLKNMGEVKAHWFLYPGHPDDTYGDGNCLYNGFAQFVRQCFLREQANLKVTVPSDEVISNEYREIVKRQEAIFAHITGVTPLTVKELFDRIKQNIPVSQRSDHTLGLAVALSEFDVKKSSISSSQGPSGEITAAFNQKQPAVQQKVTSLLNEMDQKRQYLDTAGKKVEAEQARLLHEHLQNDFKLLYENNDVSAFKELVIPKIKESKKLLEPHLGWTEFFVNLLTAIKDLVLYYTGFSHKAAPPTLSALFFQPHSFKPELKGLNDIITTLSI